VILPWLFSARLYQEEKGEARRKEVNVLPVPQATMGLPRSADLNPNKT
jgi:hypothetical protein